jgi:23S rRNA (guanine2445-N2)-methyltransferase / 23S rRNA (guanine2069-N7)-methyltransferase
MPPAFVATAPLHLESLLAEELRSLGIPGATETRGGASFDGGLEHAYRACLWSRTASRVLAVLARFHAGTPEELYEGTRTVRWREHLGVDSTFAVDCKVSRSALAHAHFAALKVKDAVVDQLRDETGARPSVDTQDPDLRIHVRVVRDEAVLSLDLAGEPLHRRGYRARGVPAPLKENLAAAILLRARWPAIASAGGEFADPMCGSGTLVIEAAMMAADVAPGLRRARWGFEAWRQHDPARWAALLEEARERRAAGLASKVAPLRGYDHDSDAIRHALANAERAELGGIVHFERRELEACAPVHTGASGLLVTNPPYGLRVGAGLPSIYARLGRVLRERFEGWHAAILVADAALGRELDLRATKIHSLYNGPVECRLLHFVVDREHVVSRLPRPQEPGAARSASASMLANRLRKNVRHLARWIDREGVSCYRLYDADLPEYALAVDVYDGARRFVHAQEYAAPKTIDPAAARTRLREALDVLIEVLDVSEAQVFLKVRRQQKGHSQYERLSERGVLHEVTEDGCRFLVNFEDYLDTGLFLEQRLTRKLLGQLAHDRHFLILCAYTATATVHAARGGARSTTSVDLSRTYLDWARRNLELNGLRGGQHALVQADCMQWLDQARTRYGLVFLAPPTFSRSKRMHGTLDVQRDHAMLIAKTARLLDRGGVLVFTTNLRTFRMDRDALAHLELEDLSRATLPPDFARSARMHHCWRIQAR